MPMPKKDARSVHRRQFPVRWSLDEFERLQQNAAARGMELSEYLRWRVKTDRILSEQKKGPAGGNPPGL